MVERVVDAVYGDILSKDVSKYLADAIVYFSLYDEDFMKKFAPYLTPRVFVFPYRIVLECALHFWNNHKRVLGEGIFQAVRNHVNANQVILVEEFISRISSNNYDKEYVTREAGDFIKKLILLDGIARAQEAIHRKEFSYAEGIVRGVFKDISKLGSNTIQDMLDTSLLENGFDDFLDRVGALNMRTGIPCYDTQYGGLWTKEFVLIMGDTNVGKTFCMVYLGKMALLQGKKVLHVTLETSKDLVQERYMMAFSARVSRRFYEAVTSSSYDDLTMFSEDMGEKDSLSSVTEEVEVRIGNDLIKVGVLNKEHVLKKMEFLRRRGARLWLHQGYNFSVRNLLDLLDKIETEYGEKADIVLLDSPDQMVSSSGKSDEIRLRERDIYRRLLDITKERNITMVVTTQTRRGSKNKFLVTSEDVAEAYDKVRIADTVWTLNQTKKEAESNIIRIYVDKCRHAQAGLLIEADQCLPIGQFILHARKLDLLEYLTSVGLIKPNVTDKGNNKK